MKLIDFNGRPFLYEFSNTYSENSHGLANSIRNFEYIITKALDHAIDWLVVMGCRGYVRSHTTRVGIIRRKT